MQNAKSKLVNEDLSASDYDAEIRFMIVLDDLKPLY